MWLRVIDLATAISVELVEDSFEAIDLRRQAIPGLSAGMRTGLWRVHLQFINHAG